MMTRGFRSFPLSGLVENHWHWLLYFLPLFVSLWALGFEGFSQWDSLGHALASRQFSESLWPDFVGWNPNQFGGYPQGFFYPSLFHWLVGLTAKFFDLKICFYIWSALTLMLLAVSVWFAIQSVLTSRKDQQWAFLGWCLMFFIPKNPTAGGDLYSTLRIGLINQAWGLIWLHFFLGRLWRPGGLRRNIETGWLLGVTLLSHAIVGLAGLLILPWFRKPKELFPVLAVAFLTCSPWAIPYLLKRSYAGGVTYSFLPGFLWSPERPQVALLGAGIALLVFALIIGWKKLQWSSTLTRGLASLLLPLIVVEGLNLMESPILRKLGAIHWYRMQNLFLALLIPSLFCALGRSLKPRITRTSIVLASLLLFSWCGWDCSFGRQGSMEIGFSFSPNTRVLAHLNSDTAFKVISRVSPHFLSDHLGLSGAKTLNGLFAESSLITRYSMTTMAEAFRNPMTWGAETLPPMPSLLARHLRILGVNSIITNLPLLGSRSAQLPWVDEPSHVIVPIRLGERTYDEVLFAYPLENALVERVESVIPVASDRWDQEVKDWWYSSTRNDLPIAADSGIENPIPELHGSPPALERLSSQAFLIETRSAHSSWYLVKEGFFPNWTATAEDGSRVTLFRAAPNWMAFFGKGRVRFEFKLDPLEKAAQMTGWILLIIGAMYFFLRLVSRNFSKALVVLLVLGGHSANAMSRKVDLLVELKTDLLVMGAFHSCAISGGAVGCWGMNSEGQLGSGASRQQMRRITSSGWPERIRGGGAGLNFTCFHNQHEVVCAGRLGEFQSKSPRLFHRSRNRIDALKAGAFGLCVWSAEDRALECFGSLEDQTPLRALAQAKHVADFSIGSDHFCYRDPSAIFCRSAGPAATSSLQKIHSIQPGQKVGSLHAGNHQTCFTLEGTDVEKGIYCWGRKNPEMFGNAAVSIRGSLRKIPPPPRINAYLPTTLAVGDLHLCGIWDSNVYCLGDNSFDQAHLARGKGPVFFLDSWMQAPLLSGATDLMASATSTCALVGGYRACWGFLGNGAAL
jgi:hypothetical protein